MITNRGYNLDITLESHNILKNINQQITGRVFHNHTHILYDLRTMIQKDLAVYLEIGTCSGSSFCLILQHNKKTKVIGIDDGTTAPGGIETTLKNINKLNVHNYDNELIIGSSSDESIIKNIKQQISGIDIFFIDGNHSFEAVVSDFLNYKDLILQGGYVVFDDYHDYKWSPQVKHAVDYMFNVGIFEGFEVLGYLENTVTKENKYKPFCNEFILKKI
jgi:predicted O-methyltransferase YrrM